jgi:hypothetical protein
MNYILVKQTKAAIAVLPLIVAWVIKRIE